LDRIAIANIRSVTEILHMQFFPAPCDTLRILHIDALGVLVGITEHTDNQRGRVCVPIRRIVADAFACEATTLVLSHDHPSGNPQPSRADIAATNELIRTVAPLGIRVHDHVVTGTGCHFSFREAGLL